MANDNQLVVSFLTIRKSIGLLGIALPLVLMIVTLVSGACENVLPSISHYYHTVVRDIFVGILCAVSLFLFCYVGYDAKDNVSGKLAGGFALGIAFFPTTLDAALPPCLFAPISTASIIGKIHLACAAAFFLVLSYFSLVLFTRSGGNMTEQKKKRNAVYKICGFIMLGCLGLLLVYMAALPDDIYQRWQPYHVVFWLETTSLFAFGTSWLVKGETLLRDKPEHKHEVVMQEDQVGT